MAVCLQVLPPSQAESLRTSRSDIGPFYQARSLMFPLPCAMF
ncbi:hypothetical protein ASAP_0745 [Asaia bogorensis]|uniref:Uncharacterized protein n=1 Tax=Asaia bogorensis TaxID=91915 RepID=A0A060QD04_9PROT|nr:hypothetical protein ASAP_0745 [Asaia bogorensis]